MTTWFWIQLTLDSSDDLRLLKTPRLGFGLCACLPFRHRAKTAKSRASSSRRLGRSFTVRKKKRSKRTTRRSRDTTIRVQAERGAFQPYKPQTQNRGLRYLATLRVK